MNSTDTGVLEVIEILELLDFEPPCEWMNSCKSAAVWVGKILPCNDFVLACDGCKQRGENTMATAKKPSCTCGTVVHDILWAPYKDGGS